MAETTAIAWCDSTFNPWIGCTKVGPGCDHCYAEALDKRHRWKGATHWGPGVERMRTAPSNWAKPLAWNKKAEASGKPWRVFCASLADVFDNEVPEEWRHDLWRLIRATPALTWLLLTKRIGNVAKMHPGGDYPNVWIGATIVNQEEADRDLPKLLAVPAAVRFVSYEPALGPVDWTKFPGIDWIIVGGESGHHARACNVEWIENTIAGARAIGAAPFVKQLGSVLEVPNRKINGVTVVSEFYQTRSPKADPSEWGQKLRVQEFPNVSGPQPKRRKE